MWSHGNNISWRAKYFLTYIDDFFKKILFYTIKTEFGVLTKLKVLKVLVEIRASLYVGTVWKITGEGDQPKTIKRKSKKEKGKAPVEQELAPLNEKKSKKVHCTNDQMAMNTLAKVVELSLKLNRTPSQELLKLMGVIPKKDKPND
jgi:hypothetical protein